MKRKAPISIAPPVVPVRGKVVTIYMDNKTVGCGYRQYLILKVSRKNVTLFYVPQLSRIRIARKEWDAQKAKEDRVDPAKMITMIEFQMFKYGDLGLQYSKAEAERAIKVLSKAQVEPK